jgi:hypothetical protein
MPFANHSFPKAYKRKKVCCQQTTTLFPTNARFIANKQPICSQQTGIETPFQFNQTAFYGNETAFQFILL